MYNFLSLEKVFLSLFFDNDDFLDMLHAYKFDLGVGSLSFSDTLLFRELDIPYIKAT